MVGVDGERFKMIRRNSLRNEVDGSFDELEEFEDRNETTVNDKVTHQECVLLNRVLSDKAKLPPACRAPPVKVQNVSAEAKLSKPEEDRSIGSLVRRITGAIPGALSSLNPAHASKKELGGVVTPEECRTLADYLTPSVGGLYLLPGVCSGLLEANDAKLAKVYEKENAEVYARLKKRNSVVAKADYPPTMC